MQNKLKQYVDLCPLCGGWKSLYYRWDGRNYYQCKKCSSISLDESLRLNPEEERKRYLEHNNDVEDIRYQNFVKPITSAIFNDFNKNHKGLDYGAGTGPVITKILTDNFYNMKPYDPYFYNSPEYLKEKYDYIACCEVMEHFYQPYLEFKKLNSLLNKKGVLYCQTDLYQENINFKDWYYKNDPTHVFFYTKKSLYWIKEHLNFDDVMIRNRLIIFTN